MKKSWVWCVSLVAIFLISCDSPITHSFRLKKLKTKDFTTLNNILEGFDIKRKNLDSTSFILTIKFSEGKVDLESLEQTLDDSHLLFKKRKLKSEKSEMSKSDSLELCLDTIINGVCLDSLEESITDEELGIRTDTLKL